MSSIPARSIAGSLLVVGVVTAGLLFSPQTALGVLESIATDWFGLLVVGLYLIRPLFAWPTTPLAVVVGYGYGLWLGVPVALVGVLVTVTPVFFVTRWIVRGDESTAARLPFTRPLEKAGTGVRRYYSTAGELRGVAVSRLAPIPSDVSTCAAAASGVSYRPFLLGTGIGEFPWTVAAVFVGASAATVRADGLGELGVVVTVGCLLAALVLLSGPAYQAVMASSKQTERRSAEP